MAAIQERFPDPLEIWQPGDRAVVELTDDILALKPTRYATKLTWGIESATDQQELQAALRETTFGDMLLPDGHSLIWPQPLRFQNYYGYRATRPYEPKERLTVSPDTLAPVQLEAYGHEYVHEDTDKFGTNYWLRTTRLKLWYQDGEYVGGQELVISGDSRMSNRGGPFRVIRNILSPVFVAARGEEKVVIETHSPVERRTPRQEELLALAGLYKQAFEARVEESIPA